MKPVSDIFKDCDCVSFRVHSRVHNHVWSHVRDHVYDRVRSRMRRSALRVMDRLWVDRVKPR